MIFKDKGYIGNFEMESLADGKAKLAKYMKALAKHDEIIAPIDGSTWHSYRLVSYTDGSPSFPMEPSNPLWYNDVYTALGFVPIKKYFSERFQIEDIKPYEKCDTVTIRQFVPEDLQAMYEISKVGFADNFLYEPISYAAFEALYLPKVSRVAHDFILIAEVAHKAVGFLFAFAYERTLILKTIAVLPEYRSIGIGGRLINEALVKAEKMGIKTGIGALFIEGNTSGKIVAHYGGEIFREYSLYGLKKE